MTYTYESLGQACRELGKQVARTKTVADELEDEINFRKWMRLARTQADNKTKLDRFQKAFADLKKNEPGNPKVDDIAATLDAARRQIDQVEKQIGAIKVAQERAEEERKAAEEEQRKLQAAQAVKSEAQMRAEQQAADAEMLEREVAETGATVHIINATTHQVNDLVIKQHETLVKINDNMEDATNEMIAGKADIDKAEEHQKSAGCGCLACNVS